MSGHDQPRDFNVKRAQKARLRRLEIRRKMNTTMENNNNTATSGGAISGGGDDCSGKKRRIGIKDVPSCETSEGAEKYSSLDDGVASEPSEHVLSGPDSDSPRSSPLGNLETDTDGSSNGEEEEEDGDGSIPTCVSHGSVSVIGRRRTMEDAVTVKPKIGAGDFSFFAVYDGHGGASVANACHDRLHQLLVSELKSRKSADDGLTTIGIDWEKVMVACFAKMDNEVKVSGGSDSGDESTTAASSRNLVGSTAVVVLVGKEEVVVANCGDSRAVLYRGGAAVPLSLDHKPDRPDELERVEAMGGRVINWNGSRVLGVLATSRSIGDHYLKPYVSSEPEVTVNKRTESDSFVIIASDGLWDVLSNEVACDVVKRCLAGRMSRRFAARGGAVAAEAAAMLVELAIAKGSKDNISVIVVELNRSS